MCWVPAAALPGKNEIQVALRMASFLRGDSRCHHYIERPKPWNGKRRDEVCQMRWASWAHFQRRGVQYPDRCQTLCEQYFTQVQGIAKLTVVSNKARNKYLSSEFLVLVSKCPQILLVSLYCPQEHLAGSDGPEYPGGPVSSQKCVCQP